MGRGEYDFSEKNMANLNGFEPEYYVGGNDYMAAAYLLRWGGAVAESNDVYKTTKASWTDSAQMNPAIHVQHVVWVPGLLESDKESLKTAILEYGAISVPMYWSSDYAKNSGAYYYYNSLDVNHAVALIGLDDSYSKTNFIKQPSVDGAWIIKNSHGANSGSNGFYYVSYDDTRFAKYEGAVFIPADESENYTAVYGHDKLGYIADSTGDYDCGAAVFTSAWNEEIAAIGLYSYADSLQYEFSIYTNVNRTASAPIDSGLLAACQTNTVSHMGYTTIKLNNPIPLADNSHFAVVYHFIDKPYQHAICCSITSYSDCNIKPGNTYIGISSAGEWKDMSPDCVCLKAYTRSTVPASDGPKESDSGNSMLTELAATNATLYTETGETFGAFANIVGANGRTLWSSWLAGFDPSDKDDNKFIVDISVTNNVPYLSWTPNLGSENRKYQIWGSETLGGDDWQEVTDLKTTDAKFFKVTVDQK